MEVLDADGITQSSAMLHGLLVKDQGAPAFVRHRYTRYDDYDHWTEIVGPYRSPKQFDQEIESLDPDTEYKFASMGSHDYDMERYGWSYPKYFKTLSGIYYLKCHATITRLRNHSLWAGTAWAGTFKATSSYEMTKAICRMGMHGTELPPAYIIWTFHETNPDNSPKGPALFEFELPAPSRPRPYYDDYERTFPAIQLVAGTTYSFMWRIPSDGPWPPSHACTIPSYSGRTCPSVGDNRLWSAPYPAPWYGYHGDDDFWYETYASTP